MKRFFLILTALALILSASSCRDFVQDLALLHMEYIELQAEVDRINTTTASLSEIIGGMNENMIIRIDEILEDGVCIGYEIVYKDGRTLCIYHGTDGEKGDKGEDGHNGKDGHSPVLSARKAPDGLWYWTVDGEWMKDAAGNKIPVAGKDGITPIIKIEGGRWLISLDGGYNWEDYGQAASSSSDSPILDVDYTTYENRVKFTLRDGTVFYVAKAEQNMKLVCGSPSVIDIYGVQQVPIGFRIEGGSGSSLQVDVISGEMFGWMTSVHCKDSCTVFVTPNKSVSSDDLFTVFINCGQKTWMKVFTFIQKEPEKKNDLSLKGTSNCYIVSKSDSYCFNCTVQGGSFEPLDGAVSSAEVLWETFGTTEKPSVGDVVKDVYYSDGYIFFTSGRNGNAVIAAKDESGTILWSWHIWVCEGFDPEATAQTYHNNAGTMMDRNLGALSATPGDVGSFGLFYQWGRKDPFRGAGSLWENVWAETTIEWPSYVRSNSSTGTISYITKNPTVFLSYGNHFDWHYEVDDTRWNSERVKYDPCPYGWRVPESGNNDVWSLALGKSGSSSDYRWACHSAPGLDFGTCSGRPIGPYEHIWYPFTGDMWDYDATLESVGNGGSEQTTTPVVENGDWQRAYVLSMNGYYITTLYIGARAYGISVRCKKIEE